MLTTLNKNQWDQKVIELGGSILQSWDWGEFQASLDQKIHRLSGDDYLCSAIETMLPFGKKHIYCPRGPLGNVVTALNDLKNFSADRDIIFVRVEPNEKINLPHAPKEIQPSHNWVLSLEKTEEEILVGMKPKTRYNVNLAARKGVTVREGSEKDFLDFWKLLMETANRQGIKLHPQNYYWQMREHLTPDNLKLVLAYYNNEPVAGMLLSIFGGTATYLHGGTSQKFKEAMAPFLMHFEAMKIAKRTGCKFYDFGGIAPDGSPDHPWSGITRFKKSFGGFEVVYPGTFDMVFSPIWYNVYANARKLRNILKRK